MTDADHAPPGVAAARIALIALRASTLGGTCTDPAVAANAPAREPQPSEQVVRALALLPKPLRCSADVRDGVLAVTATSLTRAGPFAGHGTFPGAASAAAHRPECGALEELRERHGQAFEDLAVVCCGADDAVRVTVADFREWERDYRLHDAAHASFAFSWSVIVPTDDTRALEAPHPRGPGAPRDLLRGAAAVVWFLETDDQEEHCWLLLPDRDPARFCDDCDRRMAAVHLADRTLGRMRERWLCGPCFTAEDACPGEAGEWPSAEALARNEFAWSAEAVAEFAEFARRWEEKSGAALPPHVAAFVQRHLPHDW